MIRLAFWAVLSFLALYSRAVAQLPLVEEVDHTALRKECAGLAKVLSTTLSKSDQDDLAELALLKDPLPDDFGQRVQKLLDKHCLVEVSINPESRVKVARGPLEANCTLGRESFALIKVRNEAGVTEALQVSGDQLRGADTTEKGRWLEASIYSKKPLAAKLSGRRVEYVVLRLKPHQSGKREATLKFDVGQGTQDLGFRGEAPILFSINRPSR